MSLANQRISSEIRDALKTERCTDLGNARRLIALHGDDLRYASEWGWIVWDGKRWRRTDGDDVMTLAKDVIRSLYVMAAEMGDERLRSELVNHARASERAERLQAMVRLAASEPTVRAQTDQFDSDPYVLNCENGTLDLRTGELLPHRREDYITQLAPVEFDATAHSEEWRRFVDRVLGGDAKLIEFVQAAAGYSATGQTSEEILLILHGPPSSGKTTFLEALRATLGDYAAASPISTFLRRRDDSGPRNDIARLRGKRLVSASEVPPGQCFDEAVVKSLTGGDTIAARFLRKEFFEFRPQFTVWLAVNHLPRLSDDEAMWRRLKVVPFSVRIPHSELDKGLKERLRDTRLSGPAILNWIVEGAQRWQREGLSQVETVDQATQAYRAENDVFGQFIEDECELHPEAFLRSTELFRVYKEWCEGNGVRFPLGNKAIAEQLRLRGCTTRKHQGARGWQGIELKITTYSLS